MNLRTFLIVLGLIGTSSCANLFENRTFIDEMDHETDPVFVPGEDFQTIPGDSGSAYRSRREIQMRTPLSARSREDFMEKRSLVHELRSKEDSLNPSEMREYHAISPYLETVSEKIYYLDLPKNERRYYLNSRNIKGDWRPRAAGRGIASVDPYGYSERELHVGMSKGDVRSSWGKPMRVDIAGDPNLQNERWSFYDNGRIRYVFFEQGQVQGWQMD